MAPTGSRTTSCFVTSSLAIAATLIIIIFFIFHHDILSIVDTLRSCNSHSVSLTGSLQKDRLSTQPYIFRELRDIEDFSKPSSDAFAKFFPPRGGFITVNSNRKEYTTAFGTTDEEHWGISMYHGLHCLSMVRTVLASVPGFVRSSNMSQTQGMHNEDEHHHRPRGQPDPRHDPGHIGHCVAYIAQIIMCGADGTIEPPWAKYDDEGHVSGVGVSGEGYQHQCRDSRLLWDVSAGSQEKAVGLWDWKQGDSVWSVFGK